MKVNLTKDINDNGLLSHMILNGISSSVASQIAENGRTEDGIVCEVLMTVDGHEIDLQKFVDELQAQINGVVKRKAEEIVAEKLNDISWMLCDLEEQIKKEVHKRLEDWELEGNDG